MRADAERDADLCVRHEIPAIGLWRERVAEAGLAKAAATVRAAGLHVSSLCRGGFFTHADPEARKAAIAGEICRFLLNAPATFRAVGEAMGLLAHVSSYWRYRFPLDAPLLAKPDELTDILEEYELSLA